MSDTTLPQDGPQEATSVPVGKTEAKQDSFTLFLIKLAVFVLIFRSFIYSPFNIPSESMLPTLANGDYLVASKWPYGISKYSLPGSLPLIPGRIFASAPEPGDIVIFKHPVDGTDYIKRAIALPGDTVEMRDGQLFLNGKAVPKKPLAPFEIAASPNTQCHVFAELKRDATGGQVCHYQQFRETLPNGVSYNVLDFGPMEKDNFGPVIVPEGRVFVMGDNRDNSQDSRFEALPQQGVGMVPQELVFARASAIMWSTDGSAEWLLPWTWITALRTDRVGSGL